MDKIDTPEKLSRKRTKQLSQLQISAIRRQNSDAGKKVLSKRYGIRDDSNPLFKLHLDLHRFAALKIIHNLLHKVCSFDSSLPVECLHTVLLGPIKYLLNDLMNRLSVEEKRLVKCRIDSFNYSGFDDIISGKSIIKYVLSHNT